MELVNYICDLCAKPIGLEDVVPLDVPININLRENTIIRNVYHICMTCYSKDYYFSLGSYEHQFRLHVLHFFKENPWDFRNSIHM